MGFLSRLFGGGDSGVMRLDITRIFDKLIYLDSDFISSKYEEITKDSPTTQFSKTEGMKAGGSLHLIKADIHTQETKTFSKSSLKMLSEIIEGLRRYPEFKNIGYENKLRTQTCWIEGMLTLDAWKASDEPSGTEFRLFEIFAKEEPHKGRFSLVVQTENFTSNIGAFLSINSVLTSGIGIHVVALARILYYIDKIPSYVTSPYLILEP